MNPRKERRLHRRIRKLEERLAAFEGGGRRRFVGAPLSEETIRDTYAVMRAQAVRFVRLRVHPDLSDEALALLGELSDLRGLRELEVEEDVPPNGWEIVAST